MYLIFAFCKQFADLTDNSNSDTGFKRASLVGELVVAVDVVDEAVSTYTEIIMMGY